MNKTQKTSPKKEGRLDSDSGKKKAKYRAIDLFAGIGGLRLGFKESFKSEIEFVFSSEIYERAIQVYEENFGENPKGDITKILPEEIPDHEILIGGWPCQSFSIAGRQKGFEQKKGAKKTVNISDQIKCPTATSVIQRLMVIIQ